MAKARGLVAVNVEECKGCRLCVEACPVDVLHIANSFNTHGYNPAEYDGSGCTGCGVCYYACPEPGAITVYKNWEAAEWRKQHIETDISGYLFGYVINEGFTRGKAYVIDRNNPAENFPPHSIVVAPTAETSYFMKIEGSEKPISGYITEHGGRTSHAALCLLGKPYVTLVGVKDICSQIKTGDTIEIKAPCPDLIDNKAIGSVKKV